MNKFKDTNFFVKSFAFILIPSFIMIYTSLKSIVYNFSFSAEEIKGIVNANLMYHPYATAITLVINLIASVGIFYTACFYEKNYKVRKIFLTVFALASFIMLIKNIVLYSEETYRYFSDEFAGSIIFDIVSLVIIFSILLSNFLKIFLASKLLITNKENNKLILFVAVYVAFISFINIFVGLVNSLQYDLSLSSVFAPDKLISYALNAYSGFCLIYFGFRNNSFMNGENVVE